jgi:Domain of unknown function (DUF4167)
MRPQYNNNNKNRNRNRNNNRRPGGGGGGQGGGNGANRVYDSNGPDVKVRGTAQTIAEKYMQLARDAQSSGDTVAAESYYQFSDHYYRVWLAAQPAGQPIQFNRRNAEEEYDDEGNEIQAEAEQPEAETAESQEGGEQQPVAETGEAHQDGDGYQPRQNRNFNNNNNQNRDGNRNFRPRWPRRNDRYNQDNQSEQGERTERPTEEPAVVQHQTEPQDQGHDAGNWEAPSFLTRPVPAVAEGETDAPAAPKRGRKPRAAAVEDVPTGE